MGGGGVELRESSNELEMQDVQCSTHIRYQLLPIHELLRMKVSALDTVSPPSSSCRKTPNDNTIMTPPLPMQDISINLTNTNAALAERSE